MGKRKKNTNNGGVTKRLCHSSKCNNNDNKSLLLGSECPSRDYMFTLLQQGNIEEFKKLAPMFVLQMDTDSLENTFLHRVVLMCSKTGYASIKNMLDLMLKEAPDMVNIKNQKTGATPLMLACQEAKCSQLILRLVEANPDTVTLEDINGNIPLLEFISNVTVGRKSGEMRLQECCQVIENLLKYGKNVMHENKSNQDALKCLLNKDDLNKDQFQFIVKILFQHGVKLVSESGEHVFNYITKYQSTIIDLASQYCPEEFCKTDSFLEKNILDYIFLDKIIDQDTCYDSDDSGDSLSISWKYNDEELLKSLMIIFNYQEIVENGKKFINLAICRNCDFKIIKFLITKMLNLKIEENYDKIITQYSTTAKNVTELLKFGCDPNAVIYDSDLDEVICNFKFALRTASEVRNVGAIMKLIEAGANPLIIIKLQDWPDDDKFIEFITEDKCINVLKYVLDSPQLTKTTENSNLLTKFCILLITQIFMHYENNENVKVTNKKLQMILHKVQIEDIEIKVQISHDDGSLFLETFGSFFYCDRFLSIFSFLRKGYEYVKMMLELGYTVIQNQNNIVSPLTELLSSCEDSPSEIVLPFMDLLIEKGKVNVESNACANKGYITAEQLMDPTLLIPDALLIALHSCNVDVVDKLLPHWWGPPIALTAVLEILIHHEETTREDDLCTETYPLLQKYGDVPYGTTLLPASVWKQMKLWKQRMVNMSGGDEVEESSDLASPASLQELSKYVVRHSLAARALQPDVSLPQLLHQVLPPLLRSVVIH